MELSTNVARSEAAEAQRAFDAALRTRGLDPTTVQQSKTLVVLESFAAR